MGDSLGNSVGSVLQEIDAIQSYVDSLDSSVNPSMVGVDLPAIREGENCDEILTRIEYQMKGLLKLADRIKKGYVRFRWETATL
jgi:hypothetical protein